MPWDIHNYPNAFKNLTASQRAKAIRQAEAIRKSAVNDGMSEEEAAKIAIATALKNLDAKTQELSYDDVKLARVASLEEIKKNFDGGVLGTRVAIDIGHDPNSGAAAWVDALEIKPSTSRPDKQALFAKLSWTDFGREQVPRYDYISSEFGGFKNPETQLNTQNVLKAATLTNRPFIKGMRRVSDNPDEIEILREGDYMHPIFGELNIKNEDIEVFVDRGETMDKLMQFIQNAGIKLDEGADIQDVVIKLMTTGTAEIASLKEQLAAAQSPQDDTKLSELQNSVVRLTEAIEAEKAKTVALQEQLFNQQRDVFLSDAVAQGKVLPAELESYRKLYAADKATTVALIEARKPVVDLTPHGTPGDDTRLSYEDRLHNEAVKLQDADPNLSYRDAVLKAVVKVGEEE